MKTIKKLIITILLMILAGFLYSMGIRLIEYSTLRDLNDGFQNTLGIILITFANLVMSKILRDEED